MNIQVVARIRPLNTRENKLNDISIISTPNNNAIKLKGKKESYVFDRVFNENTTQLQLFEAVGKPMIVDIFNGYNTTIFAYGQTGCLAFNTPVLLHSGKIVKVQNINVGDILMGDDSCPRIVNKLYQGFDDMYKVSDDSSTYVVNKDHIISVLKCGKLVDIPIMEAIKDNNPLYSYRNEIKFPFKQSNEEDAYKFGRMWAQQQTILPVYYKNLSPYLRRRIILGVHDYVNSTNRSSFKKIPLYKIYLPTFMKDDFLFLCQMSGIEVKTSPLIKKSTLIQDSFVNFLEFEDYIPNDINYTNFTFLRYPDFNVKRIGNLSVGKSNLIKIIKDKRALYYGFQISGNGRFVLGNGVITHNSGKSYSLTGYSPMDDNYDTYTDNIQLWKRQEDMGIVPRMINSIFKHIENDTTELINYTIYVTYTEIYMEKIRDLLNPSKDNLKLRENPNGDIWVDNVTGYYAGSYDDVMNILRKGDMNRSVAATKMNAHSSRSHSVFTIEVTQITKKTNSTKKSRIVFTDLAGSEKIKNTGATGKLLKEAQYTNKSLSTLGLVIRSIVEKSKHIPYRDSKLTRILSDSIGGNSKTCLLVTCSPAGSNKEETLSTLRFGTNAKKIKNKPIVNSEHNVSEYKELLTKAKRKINNLEIINIELEKNNLKLRNLDTTDNISPDFHKSSANKIEHLEQEIDNYISNKLELNDEITQKEGEITTLQQEIELLDLEIQKINNLKDTIHDQTLILKQYELEIVSIKIKNEELQILLQKYKDNDNDQLQYYDKTKKELENITAEASNINEKNQKLIQREDHYMKIAESKLTHIKLLEDTMKETALNSQYEIKKYRDTVQQLKRKIRFMEDMIITDDKTCSNLKVPTNSNILVSVGSMG
jgi:hypothetical protein